jgi:hypothetical protein
MPPHRALHPLLLEARYWRNRLKAQKSVRRNLLLVPRPDLSRPSIEVQELRFLAHDEARLWGLMGRCRLHHAPSAARIRVIRPGEQAEVEAGCVEAGCADFILLELPGRRLEDRVLDVARLWELIASIDGIDPSRVRLDMPSREDAPDEFLIVEELRAVGLVG